MDVFARIFNNSGFPVGDEFPVNAASANICANPVVAGSSQGGFAVAWGQNENLGLTAGSAFGVFLSGVQTTPSTNSWDIFGCLFDANGTATTAPFRINSYTYGDQYAPQIAALGANYMAVWTSLSQPNLVISSSQTNLVVDPWEGVYGQWITGSGSLVLTNDLHVNTTVISRQIHPAVAADGANRFLTLWSSFAPYGNFDLFAQQYFQPAGQ